MLYPSIDKLMTVIDSKYSLVTVAARRARQFQEDEDPKLDKYFSYKYVGKALEEIYDGVIKVKEVKE
ncbi:DNA-directed RNA polymerase subunit omega [Lederbergia citrea]|uniref:DNA-directed RNA polymerase subunit omega n=1 Tax=Lederbergia citrea TaxID=2833581 RepID=A0A942UMD2_9BACI|nr:DNA-directed RNA polymerase subunit omega [Lederbergia citrea]MBS4177176.1 DNA-directed RNA polymerase subunit omega [Lederbergia citrea]MBS4203839.1 DNA-directed RNA polymerase subunit omega [Lederbergia citrea]MBS4221576.1 DNA-directed RNA polymerase subunit omega [Lederbergia citrea]